MRPMPVAERSRPSGLSPPPPPRSELSEAASWTAWSARDLGHRAAEQDARDDLVLRQAGRGGEGDLRVVAPPETLMPTSTSSMSLVASTDRCADRPARPAKMTGRVHPEAAAGEAQIAADQLELADELPASRSCRHAQILGRPFGFEPHAGRRRRGCRRSGGGRAARCSARGRRHSARSAAGAARRGGARPASCAHLGGGLPDELVAHLAERELARDQRPWRRR